MSSCVLVIDYAIRVARPAGSFNDLKKMWSPHTWRKARMIGHALRKRGDLRLRVRDGRSREAGAHNTPVGKWPTDQNGPGYQDHQGHRHHSERDIAVGHVDEDGDHFRQKLIASIVSAMSNLLSDSSWLRKEADHQKVLEPPDDFRQICILNASYLTTKR